MVLKYSFCKFENKKIINSMNESWERVEIEFLNKMSFKHHEKQKLVSVICNVLVQKRSKRLSETVVTIQVEFKVIENKR